MCMPSKSLRISPLYSHKVLSRVEMAQSLRIRGEIHYHELNRNFFPARDWPSQNMDFFMNTIYSQFARKNRLKNR